MSVLRVEDRDRVRLLTLNRPDQLNAFNDELYDAVRDALAEAAARPGTAVVVITGEGRAFSAGQDLSEMARRPAHDDGKPHGFFPFIETVESFPKPLVAAVNGIGVGIGLTILPHCDLVLIAEGARLRAPFIRLGIAAEAASTVLLPALIGWQETAHLLYTASFIDAARAVEVGLAWKLCHPDTLLDEAMEVAESMAKMPISGLEATKRLLLDARLEASRAARARETEAIAKLAGGPANREAVRAFREKRDPDFTNLPT